MKPNYHPSLTDGSSAPSRSSPGPAQGSEAGELFASLPRKNGDEELRIARRTFNGYEYIDLRVFFRGDDDQFRPTKTGVTLKPHELDEVIRALTKARGARK